MLSSEFPVITSELGTGLGPFGTMTPYDSTKVNNGARNPLGSLFFLPAKAQSGTSLSSVAGYGAGLWVRYVLYYDSSAPAVKTGPAPVYWADNTFTKVVGTFASGVSASLSSSVAGWLLPNAGTVSGVGAGTTLFTATTLNNGTSGSYVFIGVQGFIPSAYVGSASANNLLYASGDFTPTGVTADAASAYYYTICGQVIGSPSSNIGNILARGNLF